MVSPRRRRTVGGAPPIPVVLPVRAAEGLSIRRAKTVSRKIEFAQCHALTPKTDRPRRTGIARSEQGLSWLTRSPVDSPGLRRLAVERETQFPSW